MWVFPHFLKFTIHFVRSGGHLSPVFVLRPLSYLKHRSIDAHYPFYTHRIYATDNLGVTPKNEVATFEVSLN